VCVVGTFKCMTPYIVTVGQLVQEIKQGVTQTERQCKEHKACLSGKERFLNVNT
jgi:hypothetical protein